MPQRRILYLDNTCLRAYRIAGGQVMAEGSFTADNTGMEAFGTYLQQQHGSIFHLLADLAEEGYQVEDIPHTTGKDRAALVTRKLGQHYYGTPYNVAISQGRLKTGRRDERLMLLALTRPQVVDPWLAQLRNHSAILAALNSLPQLISGLLPRQAAQTCLLITQSTAGLRQTFIGDGRMRFSRLTTKPRGSADDAAMATIIEAGKMHQYLSSQRLIDRSKPLDTYLLVHPADAAATRERCRDNALLRFEILDLLQEAKHAGLNTPLADSRADLLFCHLQGKAPPSEQLAPAAERQFHRLWQLRSGLKGASAILFAAGLLYAAKQGLDILALQDEVAQAQQQTQLDQQRYDSVLQTLPKIPLSTDNLRAVVGRYDQVEKRAPGPAPLLVQLSQSLDAFPVINVEKIEWSIIEQFQAPVGDTALPGQLPPDFGSGPYAQATVFAELPVRMIGDQRGQLNLVNEFVRHLGLAPQTVAYILQPPVDTQSGKTLKSGDEKSTPEAPKFSLRVTRKL